MIKREAHWNTILNQYFREKKIYCNYELKKTITNSLPFSAVKEHQWRGLLSAEENGLVWKYSDQDQREKPFDGSSNPPLLGIVIIKYPISFVFIKIKVFLFEKQNSKQKSLTYERAKEISYQQVLL